MFRQFSLVFIFSVPERLGMIVATNFELTFALSIIYMAVIFCCYSSFINQALFLTVSIKWAVVLIPSVALWRIFLFVLLNYFGVVFPYVIYHIGGAAVAYFYSAQVKDCSNSILVSLFPFHFLRVLIIFYTSSLSLFTQTHKFLTSH